MPGNSTRALLATVMVSFVGASDALARPPRARTESGVIVSVDETAHVLRLRRSNRSEPLSVIWNSRTRVVSGQQFTTTTHLRPGRSAQVSYRSPFFGERYATKIVLLEPESAPRGAGTDKGGPKKCAAFPGGCVARYQKLHEAVSTSGTNLLSTSNN